MHSALNISNNIHQDFNCWETNGLNLQEVLSIPENISLPVPSKNNNTEGNYINLKQFTESQLYIFNLRIHSVEQPKLQIINS